MTNAFFSSKGDELVPAPHARSPWSADMLHGRLLGGLAARAIEAEHAGDGLRPARLTVDLFRNSPLLPITVETARIRDGRRIRVADVTMRTEQGPIGRASVVLLREAEQPDGERMTTPPWDEELPTGPAAFPAANWTPPFELWRLTEWQSAGPKRVWTRDSRPLVDEEPLTPFVRAALAADFASPISNAGTTNVAFINADYTLTLARLPEGEHVGVESTGHLSADGIATGQCTLHDRVGPVGYCVVSAVANQGL